MVNGLPKGNLINKLILTNDDSHVRSPIVMDDFDTMLTGMSNFVNKKAAHYRSAALGGRNVKVFKGLKYGFDTSSVTRRDRAFHGCLDTEDSQKKH